MSDTHHHPRTPSPVERRVSALESLLVDLGVVTREFVDSVVHTYENDVGPMNGARVVAHAWCDPEYKVRLLADGTAAIAELGFGGPEGEHLIALENTDNIHHVVVCTLCSCYPWPVLGLPPAWYKSAAYRSRIVREPRRVLAEMGLVLAEDVEIHVWDSSAEARYMVLPQRPAGTSGLTEEALAALVSRDSMIGTARL